MITNRYATSMALWLGLSCAGALHAEQLPAHVYTVADGLAGNLVECILQDSHGFIWFCTGEGLSRFDGYQFQSFGTEQGLPAHVNALLEAGNGEYWLAGAQGVYRFSPTAARQSDSVTLYRAGPSGSNIHAIAPDGAGGFWCGSESGLFHLERTKNVAPSRGGGEWRMRWIDLGMPTKYDADMWIELLLRDRSGVLWIGSPSGLYRLFPDGRSERYTAQDGLAHEHVTSLFEDRDGVLWVGTWDGLCRISKIPDGAGRSLSMRRIGPRRRVIGALLQTTTGRFWVGTSNGLYELAGAGGNERLEYRPTAFGPGRSITALAEDHLGNIWMGSAAEGALRMPRNGLTTYTVADGLASNEILSVFENAQGLLCAVTTSFSRHEPAHWVNCFDGRRFHSVRPNVPSAVQTGGWGWQQVTFQDHTGVWWMPTDKGLFVFQGVQEMVELQRTRPRPFFQPPDPAAHEETFRIFEDSHGNIWIATTCPCPSRLAVWERASGRLRRYGELIGSRLATAFAEDRAGNVWIGFSGGLGRYRAGRLELIGAAEGAPTDWIQALYLDSQGRLWIASGHSGVSRIDKPDAAVPAFLRLTTVQGLSSNHMRCITEDRWGRIYVGGARGVDCFYPRAPLRVSHYAVDDGLPQAELRAAFRDRHGSLWFATSAGLARLEPQPDHARPAPPIYISALRVRGERRSIPAVGSTRVSGLVLGANQNQLQVDFVSPDFQPGTPLYYQYRLENVDDKWSQPSEERTVNYATLPPDSYRFVVRALTADGVASEQPATLSFTILAPFWAQWWFRVIVLLLAAAAIYTGYRSRVKRLLEVERLRTRIATDLHDDIGASLSRIAVMSEVLIQRGGNEKDGAIAQLSDIARGAREMLASMSDIVWAINPRHDHLRDVTQRMRRFANDVLSARGVELVFHAPADQELKLDADTRREVFLVFKEAVNNIARHSGCKRAQVELAREREVLVLRIQDDGKGLDGMASNGDGGTGLPSMKARAGLLGANLVIESPRGEGTSITLRVPMSGKGRQRRK